MACGVAALLDAIVGQQLGTYSWVEPTPQHAAPSVELMTVSKGLCSGEMLLRRLIRAFNFGVKALGYCMCMLRAAGVALRPPPSSRGRRIHLPKATSACAEAPWQKPLEAMTKGAVRCRG